MLHSLKSLDGFTIAATDGEIGKVTDIYFDDLRWTVRYLQVDTGWIFGRAVLISPVSVSSIDWDQRIVHVRLTKKQVEDSPGIDTDRPVSRQHEAALMNYYGYPLYWSGPELWGYTAFPAVLTPNMFEPGEGEGVLRRETSDQDNDQHLRSKDEVVGYVIQASDGEIGHIQDFLLNEQTWSIPLLVVNTGNWWPGKHVLLSPTMIGEVSWETSSITVKAARSEIEHSPEYDASNPPENDAREGVYHRPSDEANMPLSGLNDPLRPEIRMPN